MICAWGSEGAAAMTPEGVLVTSSCFPPSKVIDTLGAGDTFNAATILALNDGKTIKEAITFGCRVAGAKCGMKGFDGIRELRHFAQELFVKDVSIASELDRNQDFIDYNEAFDSVDNKGSFFNLKQHKEELDSDEDDFIPHHDHRIEDYILYCNEEYR